jgi:integrase
MTKKEKQSWRGDTYEILGGKAIIYTTLKSGGNYYVRMRLTLEKKYLRQSLKTPDLDTAIQRAEDFVLQTLSDINSGKKMFGMTLGELAEEYLEYRKDDIGLETGITEGRWKTIKTYVNALLRYKTPQIKLSELDVDSCYEYLKWRNSDYPGISSVTVRNEQATINHLMKYAFRNKHTHFEKFRFKEIKLRGGRDQRRRGVFESNEYRQLYVFMRKWVNEAKKDLDEKTYLERFLIRDCVLIGANTMLRVGELWQLKWKDIKTIYEANTNTGKTVNIVELNVRAETSKVRVSRIVKSRGGEYFKRIRKRSNFTNRDDFIFTQIESENRFRRESFYKYWHELMEGAKIKDYKERKLTWYSLRHYGITTRLRAEIDVTTLADIAGTSISQIEKHYGHIDSSMRDRAILKDPIYMPVGTEDVDWI